MVKISPFAKRVLKYMFFKAWVFLSGDVFSCNSMARQTSTFLIGCENIKAILQPSGTEYCIGTFIISLKASAQSCSSTALPRMVWPADVHFRIATKTSGYAQYILPLNRNKNFLRTIKHEKCKKFPYIANAVVLTKSGPKTLASRLATSRPLGERRSREESTCLA